MPTLIVSTRRTPAATPILPPGYAIRPCQPDDTSSLGRLYFASYPAEILESTAEEAHEEIAATFAGRYGELWLAASPLIEKNGEPVCAVMTVRRAPWDDTPPCPFIIEVFTDPTHRGRGLARAALVETLATLHAAGEAEAALRVDAENASALALYESLGFRQWQTEAVS